MKVPKAIICLQIIQVLLALWSQRVQPQAQAGLGLAGVGQNRAEDRIRAAY